MLGALACWRAWTRALDTSGRALGCSFVVWSACGLASAKTSAGNASGQVNGVATIRVGPRVLACGLSRALSDGVVTGGRSTLTKGVVCPFRCLASARTCPGNASGQVPGIASACVGAWSRFCGGKRGLSSGNWSTDVRTRTRGPSWPIPCLSSPPVFDRSLVHMRC